jgi:hypothetical protein
MTSDTKYCGNDYDIAGKLYMALKKLNKGNNQ